MIFRALGALTRRARSNGRSRLRLGLGAGAVAVAALLLVVSADDVTAQTAGRKYTVIQGTGQTLYRIAIVPVVGSGASSRAAKSATKVLTRDLTLCGLFKVLNPKGFLVKANANVGINPTPWLNVGAQGVIKAKVRRNRGSGFQIDFWLYDTSKGTKPQLAKVYKSRGSSVRRLAHRFGNDVVKYFTGEKGIFLTQIAFATGRRRGQRSFIYAMDYDGYGVHRVSRTGTQNVLPAWAPNGQIVYTAFLWKNPDLYITRGGRGYRISKRPGVNIGAAFSPNGQHIALTMSLHGNSEIYVITKTGKIVRRLTHNTVIDASPTWSPNGSQIAFVSNRGGTPQIYVMSASGGGAKRLTFQGNYNQEPDWCPRPGSTLIAFTGRDEKGAYDIFVVDAAGKKPMKRLTQGQGSNKSPSWAPNGRLLVFESSRGGLWIMDADGYNQHRIYRGGATPAWSRR